jgi:transcriptional regulator with XRE-family HTH domain
MPRTRLADLLRQYREDDAKISQDALSAISFDLAGRGVVVSGLKRQHISRIENGTVTHPDPRTLHIIAHSIAEALRRQGIEDTDGEYIYRRLLTVSRNKLTTRDVSPQAAALDAILAPIGESARADIYEGLKAAAAAMVARMLERKREREEQRRSNDPQS